MGPEEAFTTEKVVALPVESPLESAVDAPIPSEQNAAILESDVDMVPLEANKTAPVLPVAVVGDLGDDTLSKFASELDEGSLAEMSEPYKAVWFTYDYHNVGPVCSVEECAESLRVGPIRGVLSPDVIHRLELFVQAFWDSLKVTPSVSTGV